MSDDTDPAFRRFILDKIRLASWGKIAVGWIHAGP